MAKPIERRPLTIAVVGFVAMDLIMILPRMADPGETLAAKHFRTSPGGKGNNAAVAAFRTTHIRKEGTEQSQVSFLTAHNETPIDVRMIGAIGDDEYGLELAANLKANGVDASGVKEVKGYHTGICLVIVEARTGESRVLTTPGATATLTEADFETPESLGNGVRPDLIISQLELPRETVEHILSLASASGIDVLLNAAPAQHILTEHYPHITHLIVNETEAAILSGREVNEVDNEAAWAEVASDFLGLGVQNVVITLGAQGAYYANRHARGHEPAETVKVLDATGAGDTFVGTYATDYPRQKLRGHWNIRDAVARANRASAFTITKVGAQISIPWANEIDAFDAEAVAGNVAELDLSREQEVPTTV